MTGERRHDEGRLDVIVVGGGPAGSVTARQLALAGWRVLVLERDRFPREKVCGEYLCPAAVSRLDSLGLSGTIERLPHRRIRRVRIAAPSGDVVEGEFLEPRRGAGAHGVSISRAALDQALLEEAAAAGVVVVEEARVSDLLIDEHGVEVRYRTAEHGAQEARGALIVGADGRFSVIARRLGMEPPTHAGGRAVLHAQLDGVAPPERAVEMHLLEGHRYAGINFLPDGLANVSLVVDLAEARELDAAGREALLLRVVRAAPALHERFAHARPVGPTRMLAPLKVERPRAHGERALLVGDAAGFLDPLTGEGVHAALVTATIAASVADRALRAGRRGARDLAEYTRRRRRALLPKTLLNRGLQVLLRHPGIQNRLGRLFGASPEGADLLVSVIGNTRPPFALLRLGFLLRLFFPRHPRLGPPAGVDAGSR